MNRTEDDLRTLLRLPVEPEVIDRLVASTVGVPRPAERAHTRRPALVGLAAALAVVLVVGVAFAVVAVRPGSRTSPQPPVASTPGIAPPDVSVAASVISLAAGSGYRIEGEELSPVGQSVGIAPDDGDDIVARVEVAEAGSANPLRALTDRQPIEVAAGVTARWVDPDISSPAFTVGPTLRWTVASGLVVTTRPTFDGATDDIVVAVATAVRVGAPVPVRVPFSSSAWPTGWAVTSVSSTSTGSDGATGTAGRDVLVLIELPGSRQPDVTIEVTGEPGAVGHGGGGTPVVIAGRTWGLIPTANVFSWRSTDWTVRVMATNGAGGHRTVSDAALLTFIAGLRLATSFADESTWFDATSALPS